MINGWLILDKPQGLTSARVDGRMKRIIQTRKIGHLGTLDPLATGVLVLALNEATKLIPYVEGAIPGMSKNPRFKTYSFDVQFGQATTTYDVEGDIVATSPIVPERADVERTLAEFVGEIEQRPPIYSALKVRGRRACDWARSGQDVTVPVRRVTISELVLESYCPPLASFRATVSGGTYIRSLGNDLAQALGTVGHITRLRRIADGAFSVDQALSLDMLEEIVQNKKLEEVLVPLGAVLGDIPAVSVSEQAKRAMQFGQAFWTEGSADLPVAQFLFDGQLIGMGSVQQGRGVPRRVFRFE